jgi:uncharacterized protein YceK
MKKILIILTICLLFTGCSLIPKNSPNEIKTGYGTYRIPDTWIKRDDHSTASKYFFANKNDKKDPPNNISVECLTNSYSMDQHMEFKDAILYQLMMQANQYGYTLTSSGSTTDTGNIVYTFNLEKEGMRIVQRYIVGNKKYVLVHETIWNGDGLDTENAGSTIVNSFKWKE